MSGGSGGPGSRARVHVDDGVAVAALALMVLLPLLEMAMRPFFGQGVENAPVVVQHLGLVFAMAGALSAARTGHLTTLGGGGSVIKVGPAAFQAMQSGLGHAGGALLSAVLCVASWRFVASEVPAGRSLAYGLPVWWVQACMPLGFALLAVRLARQSAPGWPGRLAAILLPLAGAWAALRLESHPIPTSVAVAALVVLLLAGMPVFAGLGGLALALFAADGLPLASVPLSHYQITVNPSLPALPLFTLAGLVLARSGAAVRLGDVFQAVFGRGTTGTVLATATLCSGFTALTGGSGVTILALGGLLLPLLLQAGYPERRGIGLVTSASALGVLLAPSVPLVLYAVIARVPIGSMFLAGLLPAVLMVVCLLVIGGFLRRSAAPAPSDAGAAPRPGLVQALRAAAWELATPVVALGPLLSGLATPTESAALTAGYALVTQVLLRRTLDLRGIWRCLAEAGALIGGVMLILGMALALANFLVDAGVPDAAAEWVRHAVPDRHVFLLLLCVFLFVAAALMEIFAALVVLVPLLLPLARSYGIDPLHFGVIFLAAMEAGFLCPPAGMNIYFASAMFRKPIPYVARAVLPALGAIFVGTLIVALVPGLSTGLPSWLGGRSF